jgi:uncharacterized membrane protein
MLQPSGSHRLALMTQSAHDDRTTGPRIAPSTVVWNAVMPALGLALILGAALLPAIAIAAAAWIVINAVLGPKSRRAQWRRWTPAHLAPHRLPGRN